MANKVNKHSVDFGHKSNDKPCSTNSRQTAPLQGDYEQLIHFSVQKCTLSIEMGNGSDTNWHFWYNSKCRCCPIFVVYCTGLFIVPVHKSIHFYIPSWYLIFSFYFGVKPHEKSAANWVFIKYLWKATSCENHVILKKMIWKCFPFCREVYIAFFYLFCGNNSPGMNAHVFMEWLCVAPGQMFKSTVFLSLLIHDNRSTFFNIRMLFLFLFLNININDKNARGERKRYPIH